jgi:hypothetical protein
VNTIVKYFFPSVDVFCRLIVYCCSNWPIAHI